MLNVQVLLSVLAFSYSTLLYARTTAQVELGKMLFFDRRLSHTKDISCHTCHQLIDNEFGPPSGTINSAFASGIYGRMGSRNPPTVYNSVLRSALFWDGRAKDLIEQAKGPLLNPVEMGMISEEAVEKTVEKIPGYRKYFERAFQMKKNGKITIDHITKAIASFESTLLTPDSNFDLYKNGKGSLNISAKKGWRRFQELGCIACHGSATFGKGDYFVLFPFRMNPELDYLYGFTKDSGRFSFSKRPSDFNKWRIPSLRNVAITSPYFHNGSVNSLEEAVRVMGKAQLGLYLGDSDVRDITEFLKTLTGKIPQIKAPVLPM